MSVQNQYPFDVAITFAGEDRQIALQLFELLRARGVSVFYDSNEQANLWGKDLYEYLTDVYSKKAQFCLMLISKYYPVKSWTQVERRSAFARAFRQPDEYILPVRLDDTEVPGIPPTIGYLDLRRLSAESIADQVVIKLKVVSPETLTNLQTSSSTIGKIYTIPLPEIKRSFTQLDKDLFVESSFEEIKNYFRQALIELKQKFPQCDTDIKELNALKFLTRIYVRGSLQCSCKIWLGNTFGSQMSIQYLEGLRIDVNQDNSMNDYLTVDGSGPGLGLKLSGMGITVKRPDKDVASPEQAAEYLWRRFTSSIR